MENVEQVRQRIKELMSLNGLNYNSMSNESNSLRVKLTRQIGEGKTLTCDILLYILVQFPDVSAEWLLRGDGTMEKSGGQPTSYLNRELERLKDENMRLLSIIEALSGAKTAQKEKDIA